MLDSRGFLRCSVVCIVRTGTRGPAAHDHHTRPVSLVEQVAQTQAHNHAFIRCKHKHSFTPVMCKSRGLDLLNPSPKMNVCVTQTQAHNHTHSTLKVIVSWVLSNLNPSFFHKGVPHFLLCIPIWSHWPGHPLVIALRESRMS